MRFDRQQAHSGRSQLGVSFHRRPQALVPWTAPALQKESTVLAPFGSKWVDLYGHRRLCPASGVLDSEQQIATPFRPRMRRP